jgi:L-ascorbate metabolism protein UlaG (beta-lactamase superfamily)
MKVTYISHSGFLLEMERVYFLFDYYKGGIPEMNPQKTLVVFVSHKHPDHYNPEIFELVKKYPNIHYVLSKDVPVKWLFDKYEEEGISLEQYITSVKKNTVQEFALPGDEKLTIETFKSTDAGVAYFLTYGNRTIYHAGDLNIWSWKEKSEQYNDNIKKAYIRQMEKLRGRKIDVAFVPFDPRQRELASQGLETLLEYTQPDKIFPMHFWGKYSIIRKFVETHPEQRGHVVMIQEKNQTFSWG